MTKACAGWLALTCLAVAGCNPPASTSGNASGMDAVAAASTVPTDVPAEVALDPVLAADARAPASTKPFAFAGTTTSEMQDAACVFAGLQLPTSTKVYAAVAYGGARQDFQIDHSGHSATRMDVAVNQPDAPVVLLLGGYEPTVWRVGWTPGTHILAVLVGGYHRQRVIGLPSSVPLLASTHKDHGACGDFPITAKQASALDPLARRVFDHPVDRLFRATDGHVVIGAPLGAGVALVTDSSAKPAAAFRLPDSQLAGPAGLEQAVRDGFLRHADSTDTAAWQAAMRARSAKSMSAPSTTAGAPRLFRAYVVLRDYTFPPGLYGANAGTFFVPKGVPRPVGEQGHSTIYDFNTMGCAGVMCGRD